MRIETNRLLITEFTLDMAQIVHENSLDEDNRRFVPDEVFETLTDAQKTIAYLMTQYGKQSGPLVYPLILKDCGANIGYVQLVPLHDGSGWEIGYHIAKAFTNRGYATEAVRSFLPVMANVLEIELVYGICLKENMPSLRVMEKLGFETMFTGMGLYQGMPREIVKNVWRVH